MIYFISDLHLGHKNILNFSGQLRGGSNVLEHNQWIVDQWNSKVKKGDIVYILGDVAMGHDNLKYLGKMRGQKFLVRGNHDSGDLSVFTPYFHNIYGMLNYKGFWVTHSPIHPLELRGRYNIHGHVHQNSIPDHRYINVCVEALGGLPISIDELIEIRTKRTAGSPQDTPVDEAKEDL